jgi:hypothetical protein
VLLMVREAVLLNSLKRLMVAAPIYEATINKWTGGSAAPPNGAADSLKLGYDDVAPVVGAQFAQVRMGALQQRYVCPHAVVAHSQPLSAACCLCQPARTKRVNSRTTRDS